MHSTVYDRKILAAGGALFSGGDEGKSAFLIESGCIEIFLDHNDDEIVLARRGAGEIVGEMALLDGQPRSASARAIEETALVVITEETIKRRLDQVDPVLKMCVSVVLARYRETIALLEAGQRRRPPTPTTNAANAQAFSSVIETLMLEREMKGALERREFELHFQPIVGLAQGKIAGFEALMRWRHPTHGLIPPGNFIPAAEANGFISSLTDYALAQVAEVYPEMMRAALTNPVAIADLPFVSVNVSGHDLNRTHFAQALADNLRRVGIPPSSLKLELTESVLMKDPRGAAAILSTLRENGMGVAIDDFGTGYSSLSYLSNLPITTLKVDRAFVQGMLSDQKSRKIVQTIINLAQDLGIPVVAEGIEKAEEADALQLMGCALGQGYLFGRPADIQSTLRLIRSWNNRARHAQALPPTFLCATLERLQA